MTNGHSSQSVSGVGLETLLDLDGEVMRLENGYSVKFEARQVSPNENLPHGIRYSLTLHDPNNRRVLGYDNAHAPNLDKETARKNRHLYKGRKIREWDHRHNPSHPVIEPYVFQTPAQLVEDFWADVDRYLKK